VLRFSHVMALALVLISTTGDEFSSHRHYSGARPGVSDIYIFDTLVMPLDATLGTDKTLWFSEGDFGTLGSRVHRLSTAGVLTDFHLTSPGIHPQGIAASKDGSLWIAAPIDRSDAQGSDKLLHLSSSGVENAYPIPTSQGWPFGVAVDDQDRVWFTEQLAGKVGCRLPDGTFKEYSLSDPKAAPTSIAVTADGFVWFLESAANRIGHIDANGLLKEYSIPADYGYGGLNNLAIDADGNAWFTRREAGMVGVIDRLGHARYFPAHDASHIARGPDGAMWIAQSESMSRITGAGVVTSYATPIKHLGVIVSGPDGNLWFSMTEAAPDEVNSQSGIGTFSL
jgi:virginiamycin B lyase